MKASLEWDGRWLVLVCGPLRIAVADFEDIIEGEPELYIYGWGTAPDGFSLGVRGDDTLKVDCRTEAEAEEVLRALLGIRGLVVPPRRQSDKHVSGTDTMGALL